MRAALLLAALGLAVNVWSWWRPSLAEARGARRCTLRAVAPRPHAAPTRRLAR